MAKLGEVCLLKAGKFVSANDISPEYNKGLYPCFGGNGIRGYVADYTHDGEFPLIGRQGALCGNVNLASGKFHATEHAVVVQPKIEMNVHWLYYALNAMNLGQYATGAAQPGLAVSKLETLSIEIPNISEQNKIAQTLYKVEQLVNFRKQQLAKLDELVKARFVEMFGDSVANTKNFPSTTLETVMTVFPQNGLYKPQTDYVQDDTGIPILRIDAFYNGKVTNWNTLKRLICSETEIDRYLLKENDIVINRVNSIEYLGKCAHIVGLKEKTVFESNMMRFHMDEKKVNAVYVTEVLCTEDIYRQILRRAKKSVNQASINQEDVKSLEILVPPLSLQNQFAAFVEHVDQQKQTVQQSLEKLELMKKALMQEYFG